MVTMTRRWVGVPAEPDRGWLAGLATGCLIGTAFGTAWWVFGAGTLHGTARAVLLVAGVAAAVSLAAGCAATYRRAARLPPASGQSPFGWRYGVVVAAMLVAIVAGNAVLRNGLGRPEASAAWVLFAVGLHFVPLARVLRTPLFGLLAAVLCTVAVVGAVFGAAGVPAGWNTVIGLGGAAGLWLHVAAGLLGGRRTVAPPRDG
jgi:hypothetical protein